MNPQPAQSEAFRPIEDLYHAAVGLAAPERLAFLKKKCGGDETLLREIASLLESHDQAAEILELPAVETAAKYYRHLRESWIGRQIGRYRITGPVGVGGMGEVYRAEDPRLGREVAIKLLPPGLASDPEALARFTREARAIAALSHPNILALHDFDSDHDIHFAVMELLEGTTI